MNPLLEKYADLIVKKGIHLQPKQILVISCPIECANFARLVAKRAYLEDAGDVVMIWNDELFTNLRYRYAPNEVFDIFPTWQKDLYISYMKQGAAFLSIAASDPELMREVDPEKMTRSQKSRNIALKDFYTQLVSNRIIWCVASVPTTAWAKKVFPGAAVDTAVENLWNLILKAVRVDTENPFDAWDMHINHLGKRLDFLNAHQFKLLKYKNALGTDLTIELPDNHLWMGGSDRTPDGLQFIANMPTEEVYTAPYKYGVNGTVASTMPLNYNGKLIENFSLTFKAGKVVNFQAASEYDTLKNLVETDENACYLGEVALVPHDSPISNTKVLFYNTLFDENASCHLAIGEAYPVCVKDGENMSKEELDTAGINTSLVHVDFMIGSEDLEITGITSKGEALPIFTKGNWAVT